MELVLGYSLRVRFRNGDRRMDARIDELLAKLNPDEDELAAILKHSHQIGAAMQKEMAGERRAPLPSGGPMSVTTSAGHTSPRICR